MTSQYLWHVTLNTGDSRRSVASEVAPNIKAALGPIIEAAAERRAPLHYVPGVSLQIIAVGPHMAATAWDDDGDWPIVTIGVAARSRGAARLWSMLHEGRTDLKTHPADVPAAPWCAARLEPGVLSRSEALHWLGDFERCLAWTWLERQ